MIIDFKTKRTAGRLIIKKRLFGIGFNIDFDQIFTFRPIIATIYFDLIFIRFWWNIYKREQNK